MNRKYSVSGLPVWLLVVVPMIVGYVVIVKATLGALL